MYFQDFERHATEKVTSLWSVGKSLNAHISSFQEQETYFSYKFQRLTQLETKHTNWCISFITVLDQRNFRCGNYLLVLIPHGRFKLNLSRTNREREDDHAIAEESLLVMPYALCISRQFATAMTIEKQQSAH